MKKALALSLALYSAAFGANNLFEITPEVGGSMHMHSNTYDSNADLTYGLKFATRVMPEVLMEFGFNHINGAEYKQNLGDTNANRYFMHLVKEFDLGSSATPYILGGFGYEDLSNNANSMDDDFFAQYGIGLRYAFSEFLHLKTELRHLASFDGRSDIVAMVGLSIPFGTYAKQEVAQEPVEVTQTETAPTPKLERIHTFSVQFPFDSSSVAPQYSKEIKDFATTLKENPNQTATIGGHTDSIGNDDYNEKLSLRRANAVKDAIVAEGVEAERLDAKGYGETHPVADNGTREGRAQNRRVEAEIYTK